MSRQPFGRRINTWLAEAPTEQFTDNKWRFWFLALVGFQLLNATLTALVFDAGGNLQNGMGAIVLAVGALLSWLAVAFLHYSDGHDRRLARGVSLLDSITLVCVLAHFTFLLWTFGHLRELQRAESEYKATALVYNERAEKISTDNAKIAASAERIAAETTKAERLRNDAAYQLRRAAEAGVRISRPGSTAPGVTAPTLTTAPIELERPHAPAESSTAFLTRWDFWIRAANLAELLLAAATLIYIRNRSAKTNAPRSPEMDLSSLLSVASRTPAPRPAFSTTHVSSKADDTNAQRKTTHVSSNLAEGLKRLRETLKEISFYTPGQHYKADVKPEEGCVWIRAMVSDHGIQRTSSAAKAKLDILADAMTMPHETYRERLERFLRQNGFEM